MACGEFVDTGLGFSRVIGHTRISLAGSGHYVMRSNVSFLQSQSLVQLPYKKLGASRLLFETSQLSPCGVDGSGWRYFGLNALPLV